VFADEGFFVRGGAAEGGEVGGGADVAEDDADVAEEAAAFDAEDGAAGKTAFELGGADFEEGVKLVKVVVIRRGRSEEAAFAGGLGEAVPRADVEAFVAAVNAVADEGAEFRGDGAFEFDGEVGDAAAGVELVGRGDGAGGAGVEAALASAAVIALGDVGLKLEAGDNFTEKEPGAEARMDEHGAFALPTDSGTLGERLFEDGTGVDVDFGGGAGLAELFGEGLEFRQHDVMIILAKGVAGDAAAGGGLGLIIIEANDDEAAGAGQDEAGIAAAGGLAGQRSTVRNKRRGGRDRRR
jgi:hypothetical protein